MYNIGEWSVIKWTLKPIMAMLIRFMSIYLYWLVYNAYTNESQHKHKLLVLMLWVMGSLVCDYVAH